MYEQVLFKVRLACQDLTSDDNKSVDRVLDNKWLFIDKTQLFRLSTTEQRNTNTLISAKGSTYVLQTANKHVFHHTNLRVCPNSTLLHVTIFQLYSVLKLQ